VTALAVTAAVVALLVAGGVGGPRLLARLDPGLAARPRWGMTVWIGASGAWAAGLIALGPLAAWAVTGPALPGLAGVTCRRCLAAADPFGGAAGASSVVPTVLLLAAPALLLAVLVAATLWRLARARGTVRAHLRALEAVAERLPVGGTLSWVVPSPVPAAYCLPARTGIVVSRGALAALEGAQLDAVLAHERAHLRGRHHLLLGLLGGVRTVLGAVPLIGAAAPAVARYAEMAADDAARRTVGTRALAGALLTLQRATERAATGPPATDSPAITPVAEQPATGQPAVVGAPGFALHAAGQAPTSRARRLAGPAAPPSPGGLALVAGYVTLLGAAAGLVAVSTVSATLIAGCV
jgi:Zn-dependent protease with chaperone function